MNNPLVSVIMCSYNTKEEYLLEATQSILRQTFTDFELIIIDDGSKNFPSLDLFKDQRVRIIHNTANNGISYSRNAGLRIARGKYIAIMDSDDIAEPNRIQVEYEFMENNTKCVACGSWFRQFGEKTSLCQRNIDDSDLYKARLLFGNVPTLLDPSCMIRKSVLDSYHITYDESLKCGMDYMMWVKLTEIGEIHNVKQVLMNYRTHSNQITKKGYKFLDLEIIKYQFNKIGLSLSDEERNMLLTGLENKTYSLKEYRLFLNKILDNNIKYKYFSQQSLEIAILYQWHKKVLYSKNIFYLLRGIFTLKGYRKSIFKSFLRHFGFFRKMDNIVYGAN